MSVDIQNLQIQDRSAIMKRLNEADFNRLRIHDEIIGLRGIIDDGDERIITTDYNTIISVINHFESDLRKMNSEIQIMQLQIQYIDNLILKVHTRSKSKL